MGKSCKLGPTGPRTPHGKETSSRNAVKHGMFSERVSQAEEKEAARLQRQLRQDLHLEGLENEFFGRNMVLTMLKKGRLDKYAAHEISKAGIQTVRDLYTRFELSLCAKKDSSSSIRIHPAICVLFLRHMKANIEKRGLNPQEDLAVLFRLFSRVDGQVARQALSIIHPYQMMKPAESRTPGQPAGPSIAELQARVISGIEEAIEFEQNLAHVETMKDEVEHRTNSDVLPDAVAERIVRIESAIENQLKRQLNSLETYRRLRAAK